MVEYTEVKLPLEHIVVIENDAVLVDTVRTTAVELALIMVDQLLQPLVIVTQVIALKITHKYRKMQSN